MARFQLDLRSPRVQAGAAAVAAAATVLLLIVTAVRMHPAPGRARHAIPVFAPTALAPAPAGPPVAIEAPPPLEFQALTPQQAQAINAAAPFAAEPIRPARPFTLKGASELDQARAERCLTQAVYYEAGFEPLQGRRAVAQVVLNRLRHPIFPKTICGVVYQGAEKPTGCQFTFTCDGALLRPPAPAAWAEAEKVAHAALNGAVEPSVGWATHYHTAFVVPYWMPTLTKLTQVGAHIFYRWPQGMGLPAAFTGVYAGGEAPIPGDPPEVTDDAVAALLAASAAGADSAPEAGVAAAPLAVSPKLDVPTPAATADPATTPGSAPAPAAAPKPAAPATPPAPSTPDWFGARHARERVRPPVVAQPFGH